MLAALLLGRAVHFKVELGSPQRFTLDLQVDCISWLLGSFVVASGSKLLHLDVDSSSRRCLGFEVDGGSVSHFHVEGASLNDL